MEPPQDSNSPIQFLKNLDFLDVLCCYFASNETEIRSMDAKELAIEISSRLLTHYRLNIAGTSFTHSIHSKTR